MRKTSLTHLQMAQCSRLAALRKQLGLTQPEVAIALKDFTDSESASRGRIANWEYRKAPIPTGIWKRLPAILSKALESKKAETNSALTALASIQKEWTGEISKPASCSEGER